MGKGLFTTAQAAAKLGLTPDRVRVLAKSRGLGARMGRWWVYTVDDIKAMRRRKPGRPRGGP